MEKLSPKNCSLAVERRRYERDSEKEQIVKILGGISVVIGISMFFGWAGYRTVAVINFNRHCEGFLKNAADANSIEQAEERLAIAVKYIQDHNLDDDGHTSILWNTPDADVGFWANNLNDALVELQELSPESTPLEKSNLLMKLRETILDDGGSGVSVTSPEGIEIYPNNVGLCWLSVLSLVGICGGAVMASRL